MTPSPETEAGPAAPKREPPAMLAAVIVPFVFALTLLTFAWPAARLSPRDLPIGVAGPSAVTGPIEQQLQQHGSYDVHRYADGAAARDAIKDRDIYGAIVVSGGRPTLLTASAASPVVAASLEQGFTELTAGGRAAAQAQQVQDVVPADSNDPRGSVLGSLVLPLVLSSVLTAILVTRSGAPGLKEVGALVLAAVGGGLVGIAMVQSWLGALGGTWIVNAGVLALTVLAIASLLIGLQTLFGSLGLAIGGLTMVLIANPWSGISSAPEMLPKPLGLIGQLLPPGAGGNLLRSTAFFDGAGSTNHLAALLVCIAIGVGATFAGLLWHRRAAEEVPERALTPAR